MRWTKPWIFGGIACALLNACGDDADRAGPGGGAETGGNGGSGGSGGQPPAPELVFGPCPAGYVDECATLAVPLDHETPGGETIELFIARRLSTAPASRQLWLLSGGPGQAGYVFEALVPVLADAIPGTDVYVVDHRGTGRSHRLTCAAQEGPNTFGGYALPVAQVPACLDELRAGGEYDRLAYFTTTQAARDVLAAVRATRPDGKPVFVYGGSYGTHWAHRVLQLEQGEIAGFFFDGFMTPEAFSFTHYDEGVEEIGAILSAACAEDASCSDRLGPDPLGRAEQLWSALDADPCGPYDGELGRTVVSLFVDQGFNEKAFVFPLIHRLERCSADDLAAIDHLVDAYFGALGAQNAPPLNSGILQYNIVLSELWSVPGEPERSAAELEAAAEAQTFLVQGSYPAMVAPLRATWPLPPDDYTNLPIPTPTSKPLLWLSGGLDSRTPPTQSLAVEALYVGANQPHVVLSNAIHTPAWGSPRASDPSRNCGLDLISSFLQGALDTACVEDLAPVLLEAPSEEFAMTWWGTADDWGDGAAFAPSVPELPRARALVPAAPSLLHLRVRDALARARAER